MLHILCLVPALAACRKEDVQPDGSAPPEPFVLQLPPGAQPPPVPDDNPLSVASVRLGKALFFDTRLSRDGTVSCGSCHFPDRAFSDTIALSHGVDGVLGFRNAPTLANVAYHPAYFRDGGVPTLEQQVIVPVQDPLEMAHDIQQAAADLRASGEYDVLSGQAYGRPLDAWVVSRALASYQRTLISGWSRFDRFLYGGDAMALSTPERHGWELFSSAELGCTGCHGGFDLSDHSYQNIGQYATYVDPGRERITLQPSDNGKFKVPTLRNIARTGPYMHDGAMATLEEVVDHFASGGLPHPNKSPLMTNFTLTTAEKADLIAFLNALTDERPLDQVP